MSSKTQTPTNTQARIEQFKQASKIHGGPASVLAASLAVRLSKMPIPSRSLREKLFREVYGSKYSPLCEEEMEQPIGDYRSLNELFTRGVRPESRPLQRPDLNLLCPVDGTVQDLGTIDGDTVMTAKGIGYSLASLVPQTDTRPFHGGAFSIFFLSPVDCHRVFAPQNAKLTRVTHVPGHRLLVHPPFQRQEFPVFTLNERVVLHLETKWGRCLLVMVAGWGVGNITLPFTARYRWADRPSGIADPYPDGEVRANRKLGMRRGKVSAAVFEQPIELEAGDWAATFELGSTVIMLTEPQEDCYAFISSDDKVRYGEPAYCFAPGCGGQSGWKGRSPEGAP